MKENEPIAASGQPTPYKVSIAYCGAPYSGWQSQKDGTGIQDEVSKALRIILRHPVKLVGASRTDAGVHALCQIATFQSAVPFDRLRWLRSLQALLPDTIGVLDIEAVSAAFHPIRSARAKVYRYLIYCGPSRQPMIAPYAWQILMPLDFDSMQRASRCLEGKLDFSSFCAIDSSAKTRLRQIFEIGWCRRKFTIEIWIIGEGFLKQMVRIIVGTLVEIGRGVKEAGSIVEVLQARDRTRAGPTAPAKGLTLVDVAYDHVPVVSDYRNRILTG